MTPDLDRMRNFWDDTVQLFLVIADLLRFFNCNEIIIFFMTYTPHLFWGISLILCLESGY